MYYLFIQGIDMMKGTKGKGAAKHSKETLKPVDDRLVLLFCPTFLRLKLKDIIPFHDLFL